MVCRSLFAFFCVFAFVACDGKSAEQADPFSPQSPDSAALGGAQAHSARVGASAVEPFRSESKYAAQLAPCALAQNAQQSCTLERLPLIGMEQVYPSVDDIMDRVLVSHQWMGQRFEEMLHALPSDVRVLMNPVTAIVLAEDIRPSYYWSLTGAIYIDAYHLWQTAEEKSTFSDFVSFSSAEQALSPLPFQAWWRYVKDDDFAFRIGGSWDETTRDVEANRMRLAAVLFHELAHANDYFPPAHIDELEHSWSVVDARAKMQAQRASEALYNQAPLTSQVMFDVAQVIHRQAGHAELSAVMSAEEVGMAFQMGLANDDYAYVSRFEDVAMLFEETMMLRHFGVQRDVAYLTPAEDSAALDCDDYRVAWGMRTRIADPAIAPRAQLVAQALMPSRQWQAFFAELPPAQFLSFGSGWCQSLLVGNDAAAMAEPTHARLPAGGYLQQRLYPHAH